MVSQRGVLNLAQSDGQRDAYLRRGNAMRLHGIDADYLDRDGVRALVPMLDFDNARFPIQGGLLQRRGGTVRHDAVAWGYARAADMRGVDLIQNCEVTGIRDRGGRGARHRDDPRVHRRQEAWGSPAPATPPASPPWPACACRSRATCLQAFVSRRRSSLLVDQCGHVRRRALLHQPVRQGGAGVRRLDIDGYNSYAQRGNLPAVEEVMEEAMAVMPSLGRVRVLRSWGGIMDMSMDGSPIIDRTDIDGLYLNCGWCYGGFKATPASGFCFAHTIAENAPHELNAPYRLDRFATGHLINEHGAGAQPNLH